MLNFTEEIKNEIISTDISDKNAFLSAFIRTSGSIICKNGLFGFEIVTENERTAEFLTETLGLWNYAHRFKCKIRFNERQG